MAGLNFRDLEILRIRTILVKISERLGCNIRFLRDHLSCSCSIGFRGGLFKYLYGRPNIYLVFKSFRRCVCFQRGPFRDGFLSILPFLSFVLGCESGWSAKARRAGLCIRTISVPRARKKSRIGRSSCFLLHFRFLFRFTLRVLPPGRKIVRRREYSQFPPLPPYPTSFYRHCLIFHLL